MSKLTGYDLFRSMLNAMMEELKKASNPARSFRYSRTPRYRPWRGANAWNMWGNGNE